MMMRKEVLIERAAEYAESIEDVMSKTQSTVKKLQDALDKANEKLDKAKEILAKCTVYSKAAQDFLKEELK